MAKVVKRSYSSAKREEQAKATRRSVVDAAYRLFTTTGYVATTIQAVSDEAGVAVQTVYAIFGTKRELLRQVLEAGVVGDADVDTAVDGPDFQAIADEPDPRRRAEMDAATSTQIAQRVAPIIKVVNEAAASDPEFAETRRAITAQRRADMSAVAKLLGGEEGLKVPLEEAVGTLYILFNPEAFTYLTEDLGWSVKRYEKWLATMLYRSLLAD
jgi:AcrR family transcriptional regulator